MQDVGVAARSKRRATVANREPGDYRVLGVGRHDASHRVRPHAVVRPRLAAAEYDRFGPAAGGAERDGLVRYDDTCPPKRGALCEGAIDAGGDIDRAAAGDGIDAGLDRELRRVERAGIGVAARLGDIDVGVCRNGRRRGRECRRCGKCA